MLELKVKAFGIGGVLAGLAGALYAHYSSYIVPEIYVPLLTIYIFLALTAGGNGNNFGAVIGAFVVVFFLESTRFLIGVVPWLSAEQLAALREFLVGLLLLLVLFFRPRGLMPEPLARLAPIHGNDQKRSGEAADSARRRGASTRLRGLRRTASGTKCTGAAEILSDRRGVEAAAGKPDVAVGTQQVERRSGDPARGELCGRCRRSPGSRARARRSPNPTRRLLAPVCPITSRLKRVSSSLPKRSSAGPSARQLEPQPREAVAGRGAPFGRPASVCDSALSG